MRPVNLIPPEERRGENTPLRTGPAAYGVIGILVLALIAIFMVVTTGNKISERENQLASLEAREAAARAAAEGLAPYAQFAEMAQARDQTVTSLAQSRFDWERVLRELALVITDDVWLTSTTGTVTPDVALEGATTISLRASVPGPALELVGCGSSQDAVAEFVAALEDIDGVTRVGLASSERDPSAAAGSGSTATSTEEAGGGSSDCRTRDFIAQFEIVVAFDSAPVTSGAEAILPPTAAPATPTETTDATAPQQEAAASAAEQTGEAQEAANVVTGGGAQ
jgi:Tfp pilus assembly protein PilN